MAAVQMEQAGQSGQARPTVADGRLNGAEAMAVAGDEAALRQAIRGTLAAYRRADEEGQLLGQLQGVRPWTAEQAARAAAVARETLRLRQEYGRLTRELSRVQHVA